MFSCRDAVFLCHSSIDKVSYNEDSIPKRITLTMELCSPFYLDDIIEEPKGVSNIENSTYNTEYRYLFSLGVPDINHA